MCTFYVPISASSLLPNKSSPAEYVNFQPSISINGNSIHFDTALPELLDGRLYVNAQFFEHPEIQASVYKFLDQDYSKVSIYHTNGWFHINVDSSVYQFNDNSSIDSLYNQKEWTTSLPYLAEGDIMVPLRSIAEDIGITVRWDQQSKTTMLVTDSAFQSELSPQEEWNEYLGEKVIELDDPSGKAITEDEIINYITANNLQVLDYKIIHKYMAMLLLIEKEDDIEYLIETSIERLRNGKLDRFVSVGIGGDVNNALVKRSGNLVQVGILSQGINKAFTHFIVTYSNDTRDSVTYNLEGKQGLIFEVPDGVTFGTIIFYGKDNYTYETYFW